MANSKVWENLVVGPDGVVQPYVSPRGRSERLPGGGVSVMPPVENIGVELNPRGVATAPLSSQIQGQDLGQRVDQNKGLVSPGVSVVQPVNPYFAGSQMSVDTSLPSNLWEEQRNVLLQRGDTEGADAIGYGLMDRAFGGQVPNGSRREGVPSGVLDSKAQVGVKPVGTPYVQTDKDATKSVLSYLTPAQEEAKYAKKNESMKRLLLITDALRHLGNLVGTTKGATNQKFNSPVVEQEARYQAEMAQRQKQRSQEAQRALEKAKDEADRNYKNAQLAMRNREYEYKVAKDKRDGERQAALDSWNIGFKLQQQDDLNKHRAAQNEIRKESNKLSRQRNSIAAQNAQTARERLSYEKGESKNKRVMSHPTWGRTYQMSAKKMQDPKYQGIVRRYYDKFVKEGLVDPVKSKEGLLGYTENKLNPTMAEMLEQMGNVDKSKAMETESYVQMMRELGAEEVVDNSFTAAKGEVPQEYNILESRKNETGLPLTRKR